MLNDIRKMAKCFLPNIHLLFNALLEKSINFVSRSLFVKIKKSLSQKYVSLKMWLRVHA